MVWGAAQAAPALARLLREPACPLAAPPGPAAPKKRRQSRQAALRKDPRCCRAAAAAEQGLRARLRTRPTLRRPAQVPQPPAPPPQSRPSSRRWPWAAPQKRPTLLCQREPEHPCRRASQTQELLAVAQRPRAASRLRMKAAPLWAGQTWQASAARAAPQPLQGRPAGLLCRLAAGNFCASSYWS